MNDKDLIGDLRIAVDEMEGIQDRMDNIACELHRHKLTLATVIDQVNSAIDHLEEVKE